MGKGATYISQTQSMNQQPTQDFSSFTGHLLIAMPGLPDPNFSGTVTLICEHNEDGAMGLVINHPTDIQLKDIFEQMGLDFEGASSEAPVLSGGPVSLERGFILHQPTTTQWDASIQITDDIVLTASKDIIDALATPNGPSPSLMLLGYAGWGPGQLEAEIMENSWLTTPASSEIVFATPFKDRFKQSALSAGIDFGKLSGGAGRA
jgi:putative transcriptional regulator